MVWTSGRCPALKTFLGNSRGCWPCPKGFTGYLMCIVLGKGIFAAAFPCSVRLFHSYACIFFFMLKCTYLCLNAHIYISFWHLSEMAQCMCEFQVDACTFISIFKSIGTTSHPFSTQKQENMEMKPLEYPNCKLQLQWHLSKLSSNGKQTGDRLPSARLQSTPEGHF